MADEPTARAREPPGLLARIERALITILFTALIVIGLLQIISRYAVSLPISRTEMLLPNIFVVMVFLTLAATFRERENIAVTLLPDALTGRTRRIYLTSLWVVAIAFLVYLAISAIEVVRFQMSIGAVTNVGVPAALTTATVPLGCVVSIFRIAHMEILPLWRQAS